MEVAFNVLLLFLPLLLFLFFRKRPVNKKTTCSGLKPYPLIGILPQFIKNQDRFLDWTTEILAESPSQTMSIQMLGGFAGVITANPANVEHMVKTNFDNYPRGESTKEMLREILGHGIANSDGEEWRWQQKIVSSEFNKKSLKSFILESVEFEMVNRLFPLLDKFADKDETIDLQDVLERFGFDNICRVVFNEDPGCLSEEAMRDPESFKLMKAFDEAQKISIDRMRSPSKLIWKMKKLLNFGSEKRLRESVSTIYDYAMNIIRARKVKMNLDEYHDLLSSFASNKEVSEEFLRDSIITFIVAGRETTSSALTSFFWIISTRPDVKEKIINEMREIRELNKASTEIFSFDSLRKMHYIHAAITETMRLYPPVPFVSEYCLEDDELPDGTTVKKGWFMAHNSYAMGRMEGIWGKDCKEFKPERWLENGVFRPESPFRYPIFNAAPRYCLGKEMSYIQMKLIIACVLENYEFIVVGKEGTPEYLFSVTIRMKGGLPVKVIKKVI